MHVESSVQCMFMHADIISIKDAQGYKSDLMWKFMKKAGSAGLYSTIAEPLKPEETLVRMTNSFVPTCLLSMYIQ